MPVLRVEDEEEREDVGGQAEVALPLLRRVVHDPPRRRRRRPAGVPRMAHVQGDAAGDARPGKVLQAKDGPVLGGVADARRGRRVAPRPLRGRDLAGARPRRAHLPQRRARRLLVHGAIGDVARLVRPHGPDPRPGRRRRRRRDGLRERRAAQLAGHEGPEVRVPRVLPGQEVHDLAPQAAGRGRALRARGGPPDVAILNWTVG